MATTEVYQREDFVDLFMSLDTETVLSSKILSDGPCNLTPILEDLCKRTGQCRGVQSTYLAIDPVRADYNCSSGKIDVAVLGENTCRLQQLEQRLRQEVAMVYFILAESVTVNQTIDKRLLSQIGWEPKSQPNIHSELMQMKLRIVWLTYELNRCQRRLLEMEKDFNILSGFGFSIMVTVKPTPRNLSAVPLLRPLPFDRKPCNVNLQLLTLVRDLIFNETDVDQFASRMWMAGRLEGGQWEQLRSSPNKFFLDMVRYMGLSGQEFLDVCFKYDKDGNMLAKPRCPCGKALDVGNDEIEAHDPGCNFYKFVKANCPSVLKTTIYKCNAERVMGVKETAYVVDVAKKRFPNSGWLRTFSGAED